MFRIKSLLAAAFAFLLVGTHAAFAAQAVIIQDPEDEKKKEKRVTVAIECGSQGVVDADWTMEFDIFGPDGKKINTSPISVSLPTGTGSGAAAQRMAVGINMVAGSGTATSGETMHEDYTGPTGELKAEDVTLKDGYEVKNVKTKKEGKEDCDHLKVKQWERCVEEEEDASPGKRNPSIPSVGISPGVILPYNPNGGPITDARIRLVDVSTDTVGIDISIRGVDNAGNPFVATVDAPLDGTLPIPNIVSLIGAWSEVFGFTAVYPTNDTVRILFNGSGITIESWSFTAYVVDDANTLEGSSVTYTAN